MMVSWPAALLLVLLSGLAIAFDRYKDAALMAWIILCVVGGWRSSRASE